MDVDQAGEDQLRQHLLAIRGVCEQTEKNTVCLHNLAALDEAQPMIQSFVD
jgi:hypothetical protein